MHYKERQMSSVVNLRNTVKPVKKKPVYFGILPKMEAFHGPAEKNSIQLLLSQ